MKTSLILLLIFCLKSFGESSLPESALGEIKFDQKLGGKISPTLAFRDESGKTVHLSNYLGDKPVILELGYYKCPMLCSLVANGLVESMQDLKADLGKGFVVIFVSVDPGETPELAAAKKRTYLKRYGRPGTENGWHFLTGDETSIHQLADEIGFHYAYDQRVKEYAHPSGFVVVTPQGEISRYFFGVNFAPRELDTALKNARSNQIGSRLEQWAMLCFHYSPIKGPYGNAIMMVVRLCGVASIFVLVFVLWRRKESAP